MAGLFAPSVSVPVQDNTAQMSMLTAQIEEQKKANELMAAKQKTELEATKAAQKQADDLAVKESKAAAEKADRDKRKTIGKRALYYAGLVNGVDDNDDEESLLRYGRGK